MEKLGFSRCEVDQAVFYRQGKGKLMIVLVPKHIKITDLGYLHWILGIEVLRI